MRRVLRWVLWGLGIAFVLAAFGLAMFLRDFDARHMQPALAAMQPVVESASSEDRFPAVEVRRALRVDRRGQGAQWHVARMVYFRYGPGSQPNYREGPLRFAAQQAVWAQLLRWRYSDDELDSLTCILSYNGSGYGLNQVALDLFGRPLSQLTVAEATEAVVVLRAPQRMRSDPERRRFATKILLSEGR